ncbi:MAG: HlyD family secretion protein [Sphingomicrobium sp.]
MNKITTRDLDPEVVDTKRAERAAKKRRRNLVIMLALPALLLTAFAYFWLTSGTSVSTDDARVKQDIVSVSPLVNGPIAKVYVKNGAQVKRGQLLFEIAADPYTVALEQAEAQMAAAQLQTVQLKTQAAGTGADISGASANLSIKRNALSRQQSLLKRGFTTRSAYDDALNEVRTAETDLADARARAANAGAAIAPGEQPSIAAARAAIDKAKLDLRRSRVFAPMDGVIENADNLQVGQMAVTGVGMVSLVKSRQSWVEANFKERDLGRMVPGQRVKITIDAYPGREFEGRVGNLGAGTGSEFSILPAQNANGNWVKVVQRVPVRISFVDIPDKPLIAGLSADVTVYLDGQ